MVTRYDKAIAAFLTLGAFFVVELGFDDPGQEFWDALSIVIGTLVVYAIPNRKPNNDVPDPPSAP